MRVSFTIPGRISGKGRPRISTRNGMIRAFTPEKTRSQEAMVRSLGAEAMAGRAPMEGPVSLEIIMWYAPPASWSTRKKLNALYVTGRPDCSNILKLIEDGLNSICYGDDAQVCDSIIRRRYTMEGPERVIVTVQSLLAEKAEQRRPLGAVAA